MKEEDSCKFCNTATSKIRLKPCGNGDFELEVGFLYKSIVVHKLPSPDSLIHRALGYFNIEYCPMCGRKLEVNE